jgi:hypothetical protein
LGLPRCQGAKGSPSGQQHLFLLRQNFPFGGPPIIFLCLQCKHGKCNVSPFQTDVCFGICSLTVTGCSRDTLSRRVHFLRNGVLYACTKHSTEKRPNLRMMNFQSFSSVFNPSVKYEVRLFALGVLLKYSVWVKHLVVLRLSIVNFGGAPFYAQKSRPKETERARKKKANYGYSTH